jgi:hypothetical protein
VALEVFQNTGLEDRQKVLCGIRLSLVLGSAASGFSLLWVPRSIGRGLDFLSSMTFSFIL